MGGGLVTFRMFGVSIVVIVGLLFITGALGPGGLHWRPVASKCVDGYKWRFSDWKHLGHISHLEVRYRPLERYCPAFEYDPKVYKPLYQTRP